MWVSRIMRKLALLLLTLLVGFPGTARQIPTTCGTRPGAWREERFLHRQVRRARALRQAQTGVRAAQQAAAAVRTVGNIALLDDGDGVVSRRNAFNLDHRTVAFLPSDGAATRYRYQAGVASYDDGAALAGTLAPLTDDDSRLVALPFPFPFFGAVYHSVYINSDGNLTFGAGDAAFTERSLGRMTAGPPRIAPLFDDLDPTASPSGVRMLAEPGRLVVSWVRVPEWMQFGRGAEQTFQVRLYPEGRIEFAYAGARPSGAVVGIAPGGAQGSAALVSFTADPSGEYAGAVAERFGGSTPEIDITSAAQRFYAGHEDAYDYLVIFNNLGVPAGSGGVLAYEVTVRNSGTGFGDQMVDMGREYGSRARLQAVMNMGPLDQYPDDPNQRITQRSSGDTPLTILAHEAGHRFLAFASVRDPSDPFARPMLGYQGAHWFFGFNAEASVVDGNRVRDNGAHTWPRFETTGAVEAFSPLDQYLMGLRGPHELAEHQMFYATDATEIAGRRVPQVGVRFSGGRRDVAIEDLIEVEGRRTPDHTVAQRRFRFAFILVTAAGAEPPAADLAKLDRFRTAFEEFFARATSNRAAADTSLRLDLRLSVFPAAGVPAGQAAAGRVAVDTPPAAPLTVVLSTRTGAAEVPASVIIPAGGTEAAFTITGLRQGVEELRAEPDNGSYRTAEARVQVAAGTEVRLVQVSAGPDPVVVRVTDINGLPYPGLRVQAVPSQGGTVDPAFAVTDDTGLARFRWMPGGAGSLQISVEGVAARLTVRAQAGAPAVTGVVNAASFAEGLAPGALATVFGVNLAPGAAASAGPPLPQSLAGVRVLLGGAAVPLLYASNSQVNFLVPEGQPEGPVDLVVESAAGVTAPVTVQVAAVAPGIFFDTASGHGAVLPRGGGYIEIYCTGLGQVAPREDGLLWTTLTPEVTVAGVPAAVSFSGMAPGHPGLYQVNVRMPAGAPAGAQALSVAVNGSQSNTVLVAVE